METTFKEIVLRIADDHLDDKSTLETFTFWAKKCQSDNVFTLLGQISNPFKKTEIKTAYERGLYTFEGAVEVIKEQLQKEIDKFIDESVNDEIAQRANEELQEDYIEQHGKN